MTYKLGILTSHPIQYQAPLFRELARHVDLKVYFAHRQTAQDQADAGFNVAFEWDVDLLGGYAHQFLYNRAKRPGVNDFFGCDTPDIAAEIRTGGFDAFLVTGWYLKSFWQAIHACHRFGVPVLVKGDSQLLGSSSFFKKAIKEVTHRVLLRQFDGFLFVGQRNKEYLLHYGVPERKMFFAPHCVDNDFFASRALQNAGRRTEIRREMGCRSNGYLALFVGRFIEKKRPLDIIHAISICRKDGIDISVAFIGSGPLEPSMKSLANKQIVPASFLGFKNQTDLSAYYAAADLFVLPSERSETWGLVVNEAMACGTPAVVSDAVGCAPDLIEDLKTGICFVKGDIEGFSRGIGSLLPILGSSIVKETLERKVRAYSIGKAVEGTLTAVRALKSKIRV